MQFKRDKDQNSNKLRLDKYYTNKDLAKKLIQKTYKIIGGGNITEVIEPSAGSGAFSNQIDGCIAYDIAPEHHNIVEQDFLRLQLPYKKGRLFIGNPPFGDRLNLARKFMKKHYQQGDYIAYILPISQLNNNYNFYEFDLVHSEDLGVIKYSDREVHCCFNIYVRPYNKSLNTRVDLYKLPSWLKIEEKIVNSNPKRAKEYTGAPDIRICSWGSAAGDIVENHNHYVKELGFYIYNEQYKSNFIDFMHNFKYSDFDWAVSETQSPNITIWRIRQHIINYFLIPNNLNVYE